MHKFPLNQFKAANCKVEDIRDSKSLLIYMKETLRKYKRGKNPLFKKHSVLGSPYLKRFF
ncbi:hypothetical protein T03_17448 [Trichinella britovi]|uniref:Uncharacterized protein n=1 Tax=Trichinella britovi TaxID=45882 RepID=A0A0V1DCJ8_TRIBR|nr:hypothetical protein T03_17448 [Trichinella britovi]